MSRGEGQGLRNGEPGGAVEGGGACGSHVHKWKMCLVTVAISIVRCKCPVSSLDEAAP